MWPAILIYQFWDPSSGIISCEIALNTLRPRQNDRNFADNIFKHIFFNENVWIAIKISLKFVPKGPINKIPALFQIMAWRRPGDKPLSEAMLASLLTHKCVTRPQWVKQMPQDLTNEWFIIFHSSNGLVQSGNKPLPKPMLTQFYAAIWHQQATMNWVKNTDVTSWPQLSFARPDMYFLYQA